MALTFVPVAGLALPAWMTVAAWLCAAVAMFILASEMRRHSAVKARLFNSAGVAMVIVSVFLQVWVPDCSDVPWWWVYCNPFN